MSYQSYEFFMEQVDKLLLEKIGKKHDDLPAWEWEEFYSYEPEVADARFAVDEYIAEMTLLGELFVLDEEQERRL